MEHPHREMQMRVYGGAEAECKSAEKFTVSSGRRGLGCARPLYDSCEEKIMNTHPYQIAHEHATNEVNEIDAQIEMLMQR